MSPKGFCRIQLLQDGWVRLSSSTSCSWSSCYCLQVGGVRQSTWWWYWTDFVHFSHDRHLFFWTCFCLTRQSILQSCYLILAWNHFTWCLFFLEQLPLLTTHVPECLDQLSVPGSSYTVSYFTSLKSRVQSISHWQSQNRALYDLKNAPLIFLANFSSDFLVIHIKNNKKNAKKKIVSVAFKIFCVIFMSLPDVVNFLWVVVRDGAPWALEISDGSTDVLLLLIKAKFRDDWSMSVAWSCVRAESLYTLERHFIRDFHLIEDKLLKEFFGFAGCFVVQLTDSIELRITASVLDF